MGIIEQYNILQGEKLKLLKFLLTHIKIRFGNNIVTTDNGVPQGSTISPHLFNISLYTLMQELDRLTTVGYNMYADDIVL
jgi:retron-type reverse transcriptase